MGSQVAINNKRGIGFDSYNAIAPPPTGLFAPPTVDLSNSGLKEFQQPEFPGYGVKVNENVSEKPSNESKKISNAPIVEDWVSDCDEDESELRGNENFAPKACFVCGSFSHLIKDCNFHDKRMVQKPILNTVEKGTGEREVRPIWNYAMRTNHQNFSNSRRNFIPTTVLTKTSPVPISTASSSKAAVPVSTGRTINTVASKTLMNVAKTRPNEKICEVLLGNKGLMLLSPQHAGFGDLRQAQVVPREMCDKKNNVLFTETECLILSPDFKLPDENQVMLKIPRKDNMYSFDQKNIVPSKEKKATQGLLQDKACKFYQHTFTNLAYGFIWTYICKEYHGKDVLPGIDNQLNHKVKVIRCDNGTEFKNYEMNQFCGIKRIKMEFNPLLPIPFWAEAVNTACYVQNRVLVTKPHNKTPYEFLIGRPPIVSFMRPFGCPVTILNTLDHLGKFDGKADEGFLVGYSITSKAFRVYNSRTRKVEENLHVNFLENKPSVAGNGPQWLFDIDTLTNTMNYQPVNAGNRTNGNAGLETTSDARQDGNEKVPDQEYVLLPLMHTSSYVPSSSEEDESSPKNDAGKKNEVENPAKESEMNNSGEAIHANNKEITSDPIHPLIPDLEDTSNPQDAGIFGSAYDDQYVGAEADINNLETTIDTRRMHKQNEAGLITFINKQRRTNQKDYQNCLFASFLSQIEPKKVTRALEEESWVEAMQEELLQFKLLNVWTLVDFLYGKKAIGTKQEEGIDYDEVFALFARIEAIRLFLAYASYIDFIVYQMDVKSAFLYGTLEEEVYVRQPSGFENPAFPNKVYKVEKALYGLHQAPRAWAASSAQLMHKRFQMSSMGKLSFLLGLQVQQRADGIFLSQDKYVYDILQKFGYSSVKSASTPMEIHKPLTKDENGPDVDVHLYRSMIGSLMYLTSSRPDIMFVVCACSRFQVQPKASHMHAVKRIFRYLKGQPALGLLYPKDSPLELIAYSDSDYAGASLDRKSITGGCQFLGCRLVSWQCKKQTIVANSTTEAEYIAASNCCAQNPVSHSKTKHIEIRYHFIRDCYEKRLIEMAKIHTDNNVADLLTKAFDVTRFKYLIASIGMLNP
ncbi:putative ribonuclease H-like domain-containing protein [Tanacetum coccineum]